jgi:hypothetical protein
MENYKIQEAVIKNDERVKNEIIYIFDDKDKATKVLNQIAEGQLAMTIAEKRGLVENSYYTVDFIVKENSYYITRKTIIDEKVVFEIEYRYLLSQ